MCLPTSSVWLCIGLRSRRPSLTGRGSRGVCCAVGRHARPVDHIESSGRVNVSEVIVAVDPAKRSHTVEVLDGDERVLATLRVENTNAGYRELRAFARHWRERRWAVEGARGVGRQLAQRLLAD